MTEEPIARLDDGCVDQAVAATSRAFWPDPLFGWFARDGVQEHRMLPIFLGALLRDAHAHGEVWAAMSTMKTRSTESTRVIGAAAWLPPDARRRSRVREARIYLACGRALLFGRNRRTGLRLLDAVERAHPTEPHWHLTVLGVDPTMQRRGIGSSLLAPVLDRCDDDGQAAYLETQKHDNLAYYERFGFRVVDEITVADSPPVWLMWRDPRPERLDR